MAKRILVAALLTAMAVSVTAYASETIQIEIGDGNTSSTGSEDSISIGLDYGQTQGSSSAVQEGQQGSNSAVSEETQGSGSTVSEEAQGSDSTVTGEIQGSSSEAQNTPEVSKPDEPVVEGFMQPLFDVQELGLHLTIYSQSVLEELQLV